MIYLFFISESWFIKLWNKCKLVGGSKNWCYLQKRCISVNYLQHLWFDHPSIVTLWLLIVKTGDKLAPESCQMLSTEQTWKKKLNLNIAGSYLHFHSLCCKTPRARKRLFVSLSRVTTTVWYAVFIHLSRSMTKPTKWYVRPAKTQSQTGRMASESAQSDH